MIVFVTNTSLDFLSSNRKILLLLCLFKFCQLVKIHKTTNNSLNTSFLFIDKNYIREISISKFCNLSIFEFLAKIDFLKLPLELFSHKSRSCSPKLQNYILIFDIFLFQMFLTFEPVAQI